MNKIRIIPKTRLVAEADVILDETSINRSCVLKFFFPIYSTVNATNEPKNPTTIL
jgi:hypothetical protein